MINGTLQTAAYAPHSREPQEIREREASGLSAYTRAKLHDILYGVSSLFLQFLYPMMQFHRFSDLTLTDSASKVGAVFTGIQSSLCVQLHNDRNTQRRSYLPV